MKDKEHEMTHEKLVEKLVCAAAIFAKTKGRKSEDIFPNVRVRQSTYGTRVESTDGSVLFYAEIPGYFSEDREAVTPAAGAACFEYASIEEAHPFGQIPAGCMTVDENNAALRRGFPDTDKVRRYFCSRYDPSEPMKEPERPCGPKIKYLAAFEKAIRTVVGAANAKNAAVSIRPASQSFGSIVVEFSDAGFLMRLYIMPCIL